MITQQPDFTVRNEGSIVLLFDRSDEATSWADLHLPEDRVRWAGAAVIEARFWPAIIEALDAEGFVIHADNGRSL